MSVSRRQFLTLSGISAASLALGACAPVRSVVNSARGGDASPISPFTPTDETWRVLSRTTFAPRPDELAHATAIGLDAWLEEQLAPDTLDDLSCDLRTRGIDTLWMDTDLILIVRQDAVKQDLQQATLLRAIYSRRQLYQVMVEFWSDHFNISQDKLDCAWLKTIDDREVIRPHALGNFYDLLWASMHSPAMLHYLDNQENYSGSPNENYARELLELHSLGVDAGYTQQDVRGTARSLTGWGVNSKWRRGRFEFDPAQHDEDAKLVLGVSFPANGGQADGERLFDAIRAHPATPRFIAGKLIRRFVSDDPPAPLIEKTAQAFTVSRGDIKATLCTIFQSAEFRTTKGGLKYKRPLHLVAGALRHLNVETDARSPLLGYLASMGQPLFQWAMPDGFPDRVAAWENNLLSRWQFALALASDEIRGTTVNWSQLQFDNSTLSEAFNSLSTLLLGNTLPKTALDALTQILGDIPQEKFTQVATAILISSPPYQWR